MSAIDGDLKQTGCHPEWSVVSKCFFSACEQDPRDLLLLQFGVDQMRAAPAPNIRALA